MRSLKTFKSKIALSLTKLWSFLICERPVKGETFLIFTTPSEPTLLSPWLKKGFQHILILKRSSFGWVSYDCAAEQAKLRVFKMAVTDPTPICEKLAGVLSGCTIISVDVDGTKSAWRGGLFTSLYTCTNVAKHITGIKSIAITPYQLYRHILKHEKHTLWIDPSKRD